MKSLISLLLILFAAGVHADDNVTPAPARYTFSWPLTESAPAPRGGTTRGPAVTLDSAASASWHSLQAPQLSSFERDRRAILALAGDYRVTFDFLEIATFADEAREAPYQSWGTERVYIDQDELSFVSLVHILDMRIIQKDGSISEPLVTKHWREDWRYEPEDLVEFKGHDQWHRRPVNARERKGQWSQVVSQVDESPRYSSLGRWEHTPSFSTWISAQTWRPLPRRELSVRKDYQVLVGTNRVTVIPTGSIQEENNLKLVLAQNSQPDPARPFLGREYGVARYERLRDFDFAAADHYFKSTQDFWDNVHSAWLAVFQHNVRIVESGNQKPAEMLSDYADQIANGQSPQTPQAQIIRDALRDTLEHATQNATQPADLPTR
jgi:hypothetical protein